MVGYIEDLELISVADILKDVSLNNITMSSINNEANLAPSGSQRLHPELQGHENVPQYENNQKFDPADLKIPNPVGYLQELCVKKGIGLPEYGINKQDGPPHEPIFSTFCRVQDHYRVVTSRSKKKGKELAAREVIMCLKMATDAQPNSENKAKQNLQTDTKQEPSPASKPVRTINYVGFLQEYCIRKHLAPPSYGTEKTTGTPNNPSFYIYCQVGQEYKEVGIASNKKTAKQLAAEKVLELLDMKKENLSEPFTTTENNEIPQPSSNLNIKAIQVLSESALKSFTVIPNPVGHLQELCVRYGLKPPRYEVVKVDGPPHLPTFTMACTVENLCQEGISNNKKKGKEITATKILNLLMQANTAKESE